MKDPYSVLGVSPSATDAEIKKAYRDLARKYHPDNYHDNPLADLAQEKMKEINEAYDTITKSRSDGSGSGYSSGNYGGYGGSSYGGSYSGSYNSGSASFAEIRQAINSGNLTLAEQLLHSTSSRNAEWNFLMGCVQQRKGWYDEARRYFSTACSMDPTNAEYQQALSRAAGGGTPYRPAGFGGAGVDMCDICSMLMCANMCCRCN